MLATVGKTSKPIRTQLCVCLASLAIQMLDWSDVLVTVSNVLGHDNADSFLEFLKILPEEVMEGRKINIAVCGNAPRSLEEFEGYGLTVTIQQEHDLDVRTIELLENNADHVRNFFISYAQSTRTHQLRMLVILGRKKNANVVLQRTRLQILNCCDVLPPGCATSLWIRSSIPLSLTSS